MSDNNHPNDLVDIRGARVNGSLPQDEKLTAYINRIKNPYHYKCGNIAITAQFDKDGPTMANCVGHMLMI